MGGPEEAQGPIDETERLALNWAAQLPYDVRAERVNITKFRRRRTELAGGEWVTMFVKDASEPWPDFPETDSLEMPSVSTFPDASRELG